MPRVFTAEHRRKLSLAKKGKAPTRTWVEADPTLIEEYLNECNEDHSLEMTAFSYVHRKVAHHFKGRSWKRESLKAAVREWMTTHTMAPSAISKACQGQMRDMSFSQSPEYREKLRVAALNRWERVRNK